VPNNHLIPLAVCCTKHSNIIATDSAKHAVEIISDNGEFLHFLITEKGGCLSPLSLGKDIDDKIWIGCANGKCIVLTNSISRQNTQI
jgi:hypothetical protein